MILSVIYPICFSSIDNFLKFVKKMDARVIKKEPSSDNDLIINVCVLGEKYQHIIVFCELHNYQDIFLNKQNNES